jgi:hypothetical protein
MQQTARDSQPTRKEYNDYLHDVTVLEGPEHTGIIIL